MRLMKHIERLSHRKCRSAMAHMRADMWEMNADRAQLAQLLREARQRIDQLTDSQNTEATQ